MMNRCPVLQQRGVGRAMALPTPPQALSKCTVCRPAVRRTSIIAASSAAEVADEVLEQQKSREFRRDVFDQKKWSSHRSKDRFLKNIITIPNSRIVRTLAGPLSWVASVATAICIYETLLDSHVLPAYYPRIALSNPQPQVLTSFALSLLLVFRTNSSYARWDEARKMWGGILNHSRNIVQQACAFFPDDQQGKVNREAMSRWTIAYALTLQAHLQDEQYLSSGLTRVMEPHEKELVMASNHKVVKSLQVMGEIIQATPLTIAQAATMQENLAFFYDALGGCERILRTPIPVSYTRHTVRFLLIWMTFLPFGLIEVCHWMTIPVSVFIGLLLLGIDEIGVQIEEPFGILALDAIAGRVEADTNQQLAERGAVRDYVAGLHGNPVQVKALEMSKN